MKNIKDKINDTIWSLILADVDQKEVTEAIDQIDALYKEEFEKMIGNGDLMTEEQRNSITMFRYDADKAHIRQEFRKELRQKLCKK